MSDISYKVVRNELKKPVGYFILNGNDVIAKCVKTETGFSGNLIDKKSGKFSGKAIHADTMAEFKAQSAKDFGIAVKLSADDQKALDLFNSE